MRDLIVDQTHSFGGAFAWFKIEAYHDGATGRGETLRVDDAAERAVRLAAKHPRRLGTEPQHDRRHGQTLRCNESDEMKKAW
jgi:hypothetical protein